MAATKSSPYPPLIFSVFKPPRMGSLDVVRHFKHHLSGDYGKIGHFGTLDPFASGLLLIGVGGAARLNDFVHAELPKTYLAVGKLGVDTDTGDWEGQILQTDSSPFSTTVIAGFSKEFIQERIREKFLGTYWQAPHVYSATKFQGKPLHEWARAGVEIKKEPVKRHVFELEVVRYSYPYLSIRARVSSGTYIRTLFKDIAQELGTLGSLIGLVRESLGHVSVRSSLKKKQWPQKTMLAHDAQALGLSVETVLPFPRLHLPFEREKAFLNGLSSRLPTEFSGNLAWVIGPDHTNWGLAERRADGEWKTLINFRARASVPGDQ